jgi:glycosyltransferase A (GT-A) superfamily protein (DUF2064 family)
LLNADSPTLPVEYLTTAFAALEQADLVMGPCDDGGYYLIAARQPYEWLFDGVAYDSSHICEQTIARARHGGLRVATVPRWYDVDTPAELERLCQELRSTSISGAIHTREYLAQQRARGSVADGMIPATFKDTPEVTPPHG